jgi:hypothetical protein
MAQGVSAEMAGVLDGSVLPASKADGRVIGAKVRRYRATFDLSSASVKRANGDTNVCFRRPAGSSFGYGLLNASVTMGANATIAIGTAGDPGKYRAAATFTAAAPTLFGKSSAVDDVPLAAEEDVIITVGHADGLPAAGILTVDFYVSAR